MQSSFTMFQFACLKKKSGICLNYFAIEMILAVNFIIDSHSCALSMVLSKVFECLLIGDYLLNLGVCLFCVLQIECSSSS